MVVCGELTSWLLLNGVVGDNLLAVQRGRLGRLAMVITSNKLLVISNSHTFTDSRQLRVQRTRQNVCSLSMTCTVTAGIKDNYTADVPGAPMLPTTTAAKEESLI